MTQLLIFLFIRIPLGGIVGIGTLLLILCGLPFVLVGILWGFIRWTFDIGLRLFEHFYSAIYFRR